jgi:hypothetical protein
MKRERKLVGGLAERFRRGPVKQTNPIHSFCDIYNYRAVLVSSYH